MYSKVTGKIKNRSVFLRHSTSVQFRAAKVMEAWQQYFYYADEIKEKKKKNANEEHLSNAKGSIPREQVVLRPGRGQRRKRPIRARVTSQVTDESSSPNGRRPPTPRARARAPPALTGSTRTWGATPPQTTANRRGEPPPPPPRPPRPPGAVSHPNTPGHPNAQQRLPGQAPRPRRRPGRPSAAWPRRPTEPAPRTGGGGPGARRPRGGHVAGLTNSS